ncbi:16S rRNA (guanine(527)-N(7))-methyltransferase RsmG [Ramlibacter sp. PS4R-6]|uniref:16S rRNA (guanine(527)-N(7))-methyltransferase RsmG n=1 Tax=Ramlibacter sp. PS4R-6 TaxID=3133438 RepID=UPI0030AAD789
MESQLRAGLGALGLPLADPQVAQLLEYAALLQKWGKVYNLTALRGADEVLTHHLLDSLSVVTPLRRTVGAGPRRLLDVGSGAGLPGVVLAISCPDLAVDCVDAVAKKAAFIQQAAGALKLPNLRGVHARVEALADPCDLVISRAFSSLAEFVRLTGQVVGESGVWMAMKGKFPADEVAELPAGVAVFHVEQLKVPGLDAERCLVWLRRVGA